MPDMLVGGLFLLAVGPVLFTFRRPLERAIRRRLRAQYGDTMFPADKSLPAAVAIVGILATIIGLSLVARSFLE
jgi:hypothetical protein